MMAHRHEPPRPAGRPLDAVLPVRERDVGTLVAQIAGRTLTRAQVLAAVQTWLDLDRDPEVPVRIVVRRAGSFEPLRAVLERSSIPRQAVGAVGLEGALAVALVLCWADDHGVSPGAALKASGLALPPRCGPDGFAAAGNEVLGRCPGEAVEEVAGKIVNDTVSLRMLDLIGGQGGASAVASALARERVFGALARRLTVQLLRAIAVGARLPYGQLDLAREAPRGPGVAVAFRDLARAATQLSSALGMLEETQSGGLLEAPAWERRFQELRPLPLAASRLQESAARLSLTSELDATGLQSRLGGLLVQESRSFAADYHRLAPRIWSAAMAPLWPHRVLDPLVSGLRDGLSPPATILIVVDAMRHDLFDLLDAAYLSSPASELCRIALHVVWSLSPTVTALNMRALVEGRLPSSCEVGSDSQEELPPTSGSAFTVVPPEGIELVTVPVIDEHVHGFTLGLAALADAVMPLVARCVAKVAERALPDSLIVVTADHGFAPAPGWRPHSGGRRYRHGGLSPFEVLVPLGVYRKVGRRDRLRTQGTRSR